MNKKQILLIVAVLIGIVVASFQGGVTYSKFTTPLRLQVFRLPPWNSLIAADRGVPHWQVTDAWFGNATPTIETTCFGTTSGYDPSDGTTNVRVIAFKDGHPTVGQTVHLFSPSFDISQATSIDSQSGNAIATFVLGSGENFDPNKCERGYDSVKMDGVSDIVDGIGLPLKQHVQTWVVFEWKQGTGPTETPHPTPVVTPTPFPGMCDILSNTRILICLPQ